MVYGDLSATYMFADHKNDYY